jgi:tetratricopeptide (TPR) repeat protein
MHKDTLPLKSIYLACALAFFLVFLAAESAAAAFPLRTVQVGDSAPNFELDTLSGGRAELLGGDGKITVILFWGADYEDKRKRAVALLQTLQDINANYAESGVVVTSVNIDRTDETILKTLVEDNGITVPVLLDKQQEVYGAYGLFVSPTIAIIDRDGTLETAVGYTRRIGKMTTGRVQVMLGLKTEEELDDEVNPEEVVEVPDNIKKSGIRLNLGRKFLERRLIDMAGVEFVKAVELNPENAEAHTELGGFYIRKGELEKADSELAEAVRLTPDSPATHLALGKLHHGKKEFEKAVAELEGMLKIDPAHTGALHALGSVYESMDKIDDALDAYRKTLAIVFAPPAIDESLETGESLPASGR